MKMDIRAKVITFLIVGAPALFAQTQPGVKADNTEANRQHTETADQQKMNSTDTEITRQIRQRLIKNKDLSVYATNVKIITQDKKVTLKGPVRTQEERKFIEDTARDVVGPASVKSDLSIVPDKNP